MKKRLFGVLAFSTLLAGAMTMGGIAACNGGNEEEEEPQGKKCQTKLDCPAGKTCNIEKGVCETSSTCDPALENACGDGKYCTTLGECVSCGDNAESCVVLGTNGQAGTGITISAGKTMNVEAVALDKNGAPIYCANFDYKAGSKDLVGGKYTAAAGDTKITATVNGKDSISCTADVKVVAADDSKITVFVYDDNTGAPVEGAKIVLNDAGTEADVTGADGIASAEMYDGATKYTVSVFKEGYIYTTVAGIDIANNNIAIPVGARPVKGITTGGVKGNFSFADYAQFLKGGQQQDFRIAFMLNSIPLSSLFSFDVDDFLGQMASFSTCGANGSAEGCYALGNLLPKSITDLVDNMNVSIPTSLPLPGGLVVSAQTGDMKTSYSTPAVPGKRIPWGIGFEFTLTDVMKLVGVATPMLDKNFTIDKLDIPFVADTIIPFLFGKFGSAVGTVADMPVKTSEAEWTTQNASLDEKMRIYRQVKIESLPTDSNTNKAMDAIGALRVSNAKGFGAVVTGFAVNGDLDRDGKIDARKICDTTGDCPAGVTGDVPAGSIGMLYAPTRGAIKNAPEMTVYLTAPIGSALDFVKNGASGSLNYGDLRLFASIKHSAPTNKDTIKASDFIGIPAYSGITEEQRALSGYSFTQAAGADMNIIMYSADVVDGNVSNRWMVYSSGDDVTLPKAPKGMADPIYGDSAYNRSVAHISAKLSSGSSFGDLVSNNGKNIDKVFENMDSLSVMVPSAIISSTNVK